MLPWLTDIAKRKKKTRDGKKSEKTKRKGTKAPQRGTARRGRRSKTLRVELKAVGSDGKDESQMHSGCKEGRPEAGEAVNYTRIPKSNFFA